MTKITKTSLFLFSCLFLHADAMQPNPQVVIDLALLIEPNAMAGLSKLSKWDLIKMGTESPRLENHFLNTLKEHYPPQQDGPTAFRDNQAAPQCIVDFLLGQKDPADIKAEVKEKIIKQKPETQYKSLKLQLIDITFDYTQSAEVMQIRPTALHFLKTLVRDYTVHILGNWNNRAFEQLKVQHKALFSLINGAMIVSGHAQATMSSQNLYKFFFDQTKLNSPVLFMGAEPIHAQVVQDYGQTLTPPKKITTCLFTPNKICTLETFFNSISPLLKELAKQQCTITISTPVQPSISTTTAISSSYSSTTETAPIHAVSAPALSTTSPSPEPDSSSSSPTVAATSSSEMILIDAVATTPTSSSSTSPATTAHLSPEMPKTSLSSTSVTALIASTHTTESPITYRSCIKSTDANKHQVETTLVARLVAAQPSILPVQPSTSFTIEDMTFELMPGYNN